MTVYIVHFIHTLFITYYSVFRRCLLDVAIYLKNTLTMFCAFADENVERHKKKIEAIFQEVHFMVFYYYIYTFLCD